MAAAKRNGELVTDFEPDGSWLGETQMIRVGGLNGRGSASSSNRGGGFGVRLQKKPQRG